MDHFMENFAAAVRLADRSLEPSSNSDAPIAVRERILRTAFLIAAVVATGGWVWLLYVGLKWVIEI
jgi:hypothetical protein